MQSLKEHAGKVPISAGGKRGGGGGGGGKEGKGGGFMLTRSLALYVHCQNPVVSGNYRIHLGCPTSST